jgi:DNA modification methylase
MPQWFSYTCGAFLFMEDYKKFLERKQKTHVLSGFDVDESKLNKNLFEFQRFIVKRALKAGKYAIFADCGLGKTLMQLEWANQVCDYTNKPVLILAPLAVRCQTIKEAEKFGVDIESIEINNYEQIDNIDASKYGGIVLDESSILKNYSGAYKIQILELFEKTPYKLACTATPSPNDELEIGNHAEFLNIMTSQDMRAIYFTTDKELIKGDKYRLKKYAEKEFYQWISTWAVMISKPSDLGFEDIGYSLPALKYIEKKIVTSDRDNGLLFNSVSVSATNFNDELRITKIERLSEVAQIVNNSTENFIIWIKQNEEGEFLRKIIPEAIEVKGSDSIEYKEDKLLGFGLNKFRVLITKSKIAQYGLNYQNCNNQVFASLDFSFESLYQSIRRSHRFGQKKQVNIYLITTDTMQNVINSIQEKESKFIKMQDEMRLAIISNTKKETKNYNRKEAEGEGYKVVLGDCVEEVSRLENDSVDYSFFSPPFGALYVFSNDPKDMSNVRNNDEFLQHFRYLIKDLLRVLKAGRLVSIHMMQSTTLLGRDGYYSIVDFRGDLIRLFQDCGFHFHAENMIRKDPKTAAIRTKNRQLMHGTTKKDSSIVRPGLADYILTFKKPGENKVPIQNNIPFDLWCKIAEPVWIDVNESDTLDYRDARASDDERHITPTQLQPIEWCYNMWCNKGEVVLSPFSGVASEGVVALRTNRKYVGIELKESYFNLSIKNLESAVLEKTQHSLF